MRLLAFHAPLLLLKHAQQRRGQSGGRELAGRCSDSTQTHETRARCSQQRCSQRARAASMPHHPVHCRLTCSHRFAQGASGRGRWPWRWRLSKGCGHDQWGGLHVAKPCLLLHWITSELPHFMPLHCRPSMAWQVWRWDPVKDGAPAAAVVVPVSWHLRSTTGAPPAHRTICPRRSPQPSLPSR